MPRKPRKYSALVERPAGVDLTRLPGISQQAKHPSVCSRCGGAAQRYICARCKVSLTVTRRRVKEAASPLALKRRRKQHRDYMRRVRNQPASSGQKGKNR